jgi:hypothetical protein
MAAVVVVVAASGASAYSVTREVFADHHAERERGERDVVSPRNMETWRPVRRSCMVMIPFLARRAR